jgi:hypothetical protein
VHDLRCGAGCVAAASFRRLKGSPHYEVDKFWHANTVFSSEAGASMYACILPGTSILR